MRRLGGAGWALAVAGLLAGGWRWRQRVQALPVLRPAAAVPVGAAPPDFDPVVLHAPGVTVDADLVAAAAAHADAAGLDVLDLVPADLPVAHLQALIALAPDDAADDPLAAGRGALQATVVARRALARAGLDDDPGADRVLGPVAHLRAMEALKAVSGVGMGRAVAPGLSAAPFTAAQWRAVFDAAAGQAAFALFGTRLLGFVALALGLRRRPRWVAAALAAYCAQPLLATAGTAVQPRGLPADAALRWARGPAALAGQVLTPAQVVDRAAADAERPVYQGLLAGGTDRFFQPRRTDCPWCGGTGLRPVLHTGDVYQHKPGRFTLEQCQGCGHVFQNPRLTEEGLGFYYRDFYDGLGEALLDSTFRTSGASYRGRAELVARHLAKSPERWLDVGAGHGHFCLVARQRFPTTRFDGLDLGAGVEAGARNGWLDTAYRGLFVEEAPALAGAYDVVSMHHYLEHTTDPRAELAAAATVVPAGGHLLIEVPDPEFALRPLLRGGWLPYLQPQHLHLAPLANLAAAVEDAGFDVVETETGAAHQGNDLVGWLLVTWSRLAPLPGLPWRPPTGALGNQWPLLLSLPMAPLLVPAAVGDAAIGALVRRRHHGNAYRILARRR